MVLALGGRPVEGLVRELELAMKALIKPRKLVSMLGSVISFKSVVQGAEELLRGREGLIVLDQPGAKHISGLDLDLFKPVVELRRANQALLGPLVGALGFVAFPVLGMDVFAGRKDDPMAVVSDDQVDGRRPGGGGGAKVEVVPRHAVKVLKLLSVSLSVFLPFLTPGENASKLQRDVSTYKTVLLCGIVLHCVFLNGIGFESCRGYHNCWAEASLSA